VARATEQKEEEKTVLHVGPLFYLTNIDCLFLLARLSYYNRQLLRLPKLPTGNIKKVRSAYEIKQPAVRYIRLDELCV
jgi:hypothetical protein